MKTENEVVRLMKWKEMERNGTEGKGMEQKRTRIWIKIKATPARELSLKYAHIIYEERKIRMQSIRIEITVEVKLFVLFFVPVFMSVFVFAHAIMYISV